MTKARQPIIVTLVLLLSTALVFAADPQLVSRKVLTDISDTLAYDLGKMYQMGENCGRELQSVSPPKAAGLFINYFNEKEVQTIMNNYENGYEQSKNQGLRLTGVEGVYACHDGEGIKLHQVGNATYPALLRTIAK